MKQQIPNVVPFPFDAQSNPFFCALASALLPVLGYTEETPFFCGPKDAYCINCGDCGSKTTLQKHHLRLYHNYQTFTGVSFGWAWPELDSAYHTLPGAGAAWRWPDEFIAFIMGRAGLTWRRLPKGTDRDAVYGAVTASVDAGIPALLKLGEGQDWHVIDGYEDGVLHGLCYKKDGLALPDWFEAFEDAIVITGRCEPAVTLADVLRRIVAVLEHPAHARLEADLNRRIDGITKENMIDTAQWLNERAGFPIEARWHAADSEMYILCDNEAAKEKIFAMIRQYVFDKEHDATHGTLWKVWGQLGVGPKTHYQLPRKRKVIKLLSRPGAKEELKRLFAIVFHNDREVLRFLREALEDIE